MNRSPAYYVIRYTTLFLVAVPLTGVLWRMYDVPWLLAWFVSVLAGGSVARGVVMLLLPSERPIGRGYQRGQD